MSEYNKAITESRKKISARDEEIQKIQISIGYEISLLKSDIIKNTPLFEPYSKARDFKKAIPSKKKMIKEISKIVDNSEILDQKIGDIKALLGEREKTYKSIYEHIGNTAYSVFKMNREKLRGYETIFAELVKLDKRLEQFNKVDITEKLSNKNFFEQFVGAAKSMYRNQKHKFIQLRYPGLYRQAGKGILTTDFVEDAAFEALDEAMKSLIDNEKNISELNNTMNELNEEKTALTETLHSLEVTDKPQKRIKEINDEIAEMEKWIEECYVNIQNIYFANELFNVITNEKIDEHLGNLRGLERENAQYEQEIKRYETLIAIDKVTGKIMKTTNKIEHMKNQIAKQEQELKTMEKEFSQLEKQKKVLEKTLEQK